MDVQYFAPRCNVCNVLSQRYSTTMFAIPATSICAAFFGAQVGMYLVHGQKRHQRLVDLLEKEGGKFRALRMTHSHCFKMG